MIRMGRDLALVLGLLTVSCATAERYGRLADDDVKAVATARPSWKNVAVSAATLGAAVLVDDETRRIARANTSSAADDVADAVEPLGGGHSEKVMAAFLTYGLIRRDDRAKAVAFDAFISSLIASKVITPGLKKIVHRDRPNGGDEAFPSNHSTQAFLLATTISEHYDRRWVTIAAYGLAGGVAAARVYHDDHWTSDVIAGALIGTAVAKIVVRTNDAERARWRISATPQGVAISFSTDASALYRGRCGASSRCGRSGAEP